MTERVESIPAALQLWGSLLWRCGRLNPYFMWQTALDQFLSYFDPCEQLEESTHQFTTAQLMHMLEQHCGAHFSISEFVQYITDKGFRYKYNLDLNFEWIFKQKE